MYNKIAFMYPFVCIVLVEVKEQIATLEIISSFSLKHFKGYFMFNTPHLLLILLKSRLYFNF